MHATIIDFPRIPGLHVPGMGIVPMKITGFPGKIMNNTGNAPRKLGCLRGHLRLVNLIEISPIHDNELFKVPCSASGCTKAHTTIKLTTTKQNGIGSAWGTGPAALDR